MTDFDAIRGAGYDAGRAAGSWVIDGNTTRETAAYILKGIEDGDPLVMAEQPAPLSGEWAGDPTPQTLAEDYGVSDDDLDHACDIFEEAFAEGYWQEVERAARIAATSRTPTAHTPVVGSWLVRKVGGGL